MTKRMGVEEFRDKFETIAHEAAEPVVVTSNRKVVGRYTPEPERREPPSAEWFEAYRAAVERARAALEAKWPDPAAKLAELGIEYDEPFDDPWMQGKPDARPIGGEG